MAFLIHKIQRSSNNVSFNHLVITKNTLNHFMYYLKKLIQIQQFSMQILHSKIKFHAQNFFTIDFDLLIGVWM